MAEKKVKAVAIHTLKTLVKPAVVRIDDYGVSHVVHKAETAWHQPGSIIEMTEADFNDLASRTSVRRATPIEITRGAVTLRTAADGTPLPPG